MTNVADLLAEKLHTYGQIAAGESGLGNEVSWVITARARIPALGPTQGGELVLLPSSVLQSLGGPASLPALVPAFKDAGASGVCLWTEPDQETSRTADALALPLIYITDRTPVEVERDLLDHIAWQLRHRLTQGQDRQTNLLDTLAANRGPGAIVCLLADTLARPVAYFPLSGEPVRSPRWSASLPAWFWEGATTGVEATTVPLEGASDGLWVVPVSRNGVQIGALAVGPVARAATRSEILAMRQTASALSVELSRLDTTVEEQRRTREEFHRDLFAGRALDTLPGRARALGILVPEEFHVIALTSTEPDKQVPGEVRDRLESVLLRQAPYPMRDTARELLILLPLNLRSESTVVTLLRALAPFKQSVVVGISDHLDDFALVPQAVEQARTALLVGSRVRGGAPTRFSETGAYGLLAALRYQPVGQRLMEQTLGPLLAYDREHSTTLVATLEAYIACNGNTTVTASVLNLHRNSLSYRLRRIESQTGLGLADAENRLLFTLALRLRTLM